MSWPRPAPGVPFEAVGLDEMTASVQANLVGQYALSQHAVGPMRQAGWGRIAYLSTGLVEDGFPGAGPYAAGVRRSAPTATSFHSPDPRMRDL